MKHRRFFSCLGMLLLFTALLHTAWAAELTEGNCTVTLSETSFVWDGTAREPEVTVTLDGAALAQGTDYTLSYRNQVNAGTGEVIVTGIGDYSGTLRRTFTITCPAPKVQSVVNVANGTKLTWTGSGGAQYAVLRKNGSGWDRLGVTGKTFFVDTGVQSGKRYVYSVRCVDRSGENDVSDFDRTGQAVTYLSAPALRKAEFGNGGVTLAWKQVPGAAGYRVFRKSGAGWKKLGDTTGLTFTDRKAKAGHRYVYTLRCISKNGKAYTSGFDSTGRTVVCLAAPKLTGLSNGRTGLTLTWRAVKGAASYRVYRRTGTGGWKRLGDTKLPRWVDKGTVSGTGYTYTVRCVAADGKTYLSGCDRRGRAAVRLGVPVLTGADQYPGEAVVQWRAVRGAERYQVLRRAGTGRWQSVGTTKGLRFSDTDVLSSVKYTYTVRAVRGSTRGSYSSAGVRAVLHDPVAETLKSTRTAQRTDQIILVLNHRLSLWNRSADGSWARAMECECGYGKNGLRLASARHEGDKTTPIGAFPMLLAFGLGDDPGTLLPYRRITEHSYWSSERNSTYNTWVESASDMGGEHLIDYYQYKYAMAIGFNTDPVVRGRGSAIFLHCKSVGHWYTAGCVSVTETDMLRLMRTVRASAWMVIVPDVETLRDY